MKTVNSFQIAKVQAKILLMNVLLIKKGVILIDTKYGFIYGMYSREFYDNFKDRYF